MQFINEQNDATFGSRDFLKKFLQSLFKFTTVLGARNKACHVERQDGLTLESIWYFSVDDTLRQSFNYSRLADTGFAD